MNKKKMILTSLASVAILGAGFVATQPTFVRAEDAQVTQEEKAAQQEFLSNFDKANEIAVKELEEYLNKAKEKNDSELEQQIQGFIDEFKKRTQDEKDRYVKGFNEGTLTAEDAEKEIEEKAKEEEAAEEKEAQEEKAAQQE
ncbi:choline-binding protein, partial [Streptococcus pseudopneumoniae]|nr:choline-binding protein [Streptococcus pseudopneumoniae]